MSVEQGESFSHTLSVNTGSWKSAAYRFDHLFDPDFIQVDTSMGTDGVEPGSKGFLTAVNASNQGALSMNGFDIHQPLNCA